jgi:hypothetical protein
MRNEEERGRFTSAAKSGTYGADAVAGCLPLGHVSCFETAQAAETPGARCGNIYTTTRNQPYVWNVR